MKVCVHVANAVEAGLLGQVISDTMRIITNKEEFEQYCKDLKELGFQILDSDYYDDEFDHDSEGNVTQYRGYRGYIATRAVEIYVYFDEPDGFDMIPNIISPNGIRKADDGLWEVKEAEVRA